MEVVMPNVVTKGKKVHIGRVVTSTEKRVIEDIGHAVDAAREGDVKKLGRFLRKFSPVVSNNERSEYGKTTKVHEKYHNVPGINASERQRIISALENYFAFLSEDSSPDGEYNPPIHFELLKNNQGFQYRI